MPRVINKPSAFTKFKKNYLERRSSIIQFDEESATHTCVYTLDLSQRDLRKLKNNFELIDVDESGEIDHDEFFEMIGDQKTPFSDGLFQFIDSDKSGSINFEEFIQVASTYCMYSKDDILKFCFDLFDKDGSGTIDEKEFIELSRTMHKIDPMFPGNFTTALKNFDMNDDGLIDFSEFKQLSNRYPMM